MNKQGLLAHRHGSWSRKMTHVVNNRGVTMDLDHKTLCLVSYVIISYYVIIMLPFKMLFDELYLNL